MTDRRCWAALALLLLATAACRGTPPATDPAAEADPNAPAAPQPEPPAPTTTTPTDDGALLLRATLPNGLTTIVLRHAANAAGRAEIGLGVLAGTDVGKQGAADLAAGIVLGAGDVTAGRPALTDAVADLGGATSLEQGRLSTWFTIAVPETAWPQALRALAQALLEEPAGRSQLERLQQDLLRARTRRVGEDPARWLPARLLLGDRSSADHLLSLQARDPSEAVVFLRRYYRPDRAVLVLRVPAAAAEVAPLVTELFAGWSPAGVADDPDEGPHERRMQSGLYWADPASLGPTQAGAPGAPGQTVADASRVLLVHELPDPFDEQAPALHLLLGCLSMDGLGGRLERLQRERGLGALRWTPHFVSCAESTALVLETFCPPATAALLWDVVRDARASLRSLPPSASERVMARGRAWLSLRRGELGPLTALRFETTGVLRGVGDATLDARLRALEQPAAIGPEQVERYLQLPVALLVLGGEPPAALADAGRFDVFPEGFAAQLPATAPDAPVAAAAPWLAGAVRAMGGRQRLLALQGFTTTATIATEEAPEVEETLTWTTAGALVRRRTLLGSDVETRIADGEWVEQVGDERVELSPLEANWRLAEAERHPLALLLAHVQGDLQFRLLATRERDGRDYVLLEAVTDRFERLRLQLDRQSLLIRVVEAWTTTPAGAPSYTVDHWSDYRSIDGLRAPFYRRTVVDDGQSRRVTTYREVELLR